MNVFQRGLVLACAAMMGVAPGAWGRTLSRQVLVVLSGEDKITVNVDREGAAETTHKTGFFLTELMVPVKALLDEGYEPVFVTPSGSLPVMDRVSDSAFWFGGDPAEYQRYRRLCEKLGLCGSTTVGTLKTQAFSDVLPQLNHYRAVFFPGGHAPMEDLYRNKELGQILKHFHDHAKPTALICHAPIALLAALDDPAQYGARLEELHELSASPMQNATRLAQLQQQLARAGANWIYRNYRMTSFSTKEERQEEPGGADDVLGGFMKFYPDEALDFAGATVTVRAQKWQSHVVRDRELITGQNPFSDKALAKALIEALAE